jgi:hypothetical protein
MIIKLNSYEIEDALKEYIAKHYDIPAKRLDTYTEIMITQGIKKKTTELASFSGCESDTTTEIDLYIK